jgi:dienelactone hydrolase
VARFARQIAGQGYIVAAPSSYHEFTGPEPLAYDVPGTDAGNEWKVKKVNGTFLFLLTLRRSFIRSHTSFCVLPIEESARL